LHQKSGSTPMGESQKTNVTAVGCCLRKSVKRQKKVKVGEREAARDLGIIRHCIKHHLHRRKGQGEKGLRNAVPCMAS